jgi:type I restriction enzyme M protein
MPTSAASTHDIVSNLWNLCNVQKNAEEKKSGAGQYFTPRPLIDAMEAVMQPRLEDVIQDPAVDQQGLFAGSS